MEEHMTPIFFNDYMIITIRYQTWLSIENMISEGFHWNYRYHVWEKRFDYSRRGQIEIQNSVMNINAMVMYELRNYKRLCMKVAKVNLYLCLIKSLPKEICLKICNLVQDPCTCADYNTCVYCRYACCEKTIENKCICRTSLSCDRHLTTLLIDVI